MTTFMKFEAITYSVLKVLGYLAGFIGAFAVLGFTGGCERGYLSCTQYIIYELQAFCLIGFSFIVYIIRECIKEDFIKRNRILRRRAKRVAVV
jgi:hypothetical protein